MLIHQIVYCIFIDMLTKDYKLSPAYCNVFYLLLLRVKNVLKWHAFTPASVAPPKHIQVSQEKRQQKAWNCPLH
jgi:hypothetical protein